MLKFYNMSITLKKVEDCLLLLEKTKNSLRKIDKLRGIRKWLREIKRYLQIFCNNLFYSRAMKPSYL
jgi:hypothetical protein